LVIDLQLIEMQSWFSFLCGRACCRMLCLNYYMLLSASLALLYFFCVSHEHWDIINVCRSLCKCLILSDFSKNCLCSVRPRVFHVEGRTDRQVGS
jgi:hypothetical protein